MPIHIGARDCFGEVSLMDLGPCSATVMAEQDCRAVELSNNGLLNLCEVPLSGGRLKLTRWRVE